MRYLLNAKSYDDKEKKVRTWEITFYNEQVDNVERIIRYEPLLDSDITETEKAEEEMTTPELLSELEEQPNAIYENEPTA